MKKEVKFDKKVLNSLNELHNLLLEYEYHSFIETANNYIEDIVGFITLKIHTFLPKPAPTYFSKYGKNLFYIFYSRNKNTTGYIFFEKTEEHYFIKHISNNHIVGHYFR